MAGGATESGRTVTSKVTAILMAFSRGGCHSLTELARLTGLPVSTTHRLVNELVARRLLERDGGGYRIGLPLRMIGSVTAAVPTTSQVWTKAADVMVDLAAATCTTVRMGVLDGTVVLESRTRPGTPPSTAALGRPPHATALGHTLLAFSPATVVDGLLAGARLPDGLRRRLGTTRLTHVAMVRGADAWAIAKPVFGAGGALLGALELGVTDPSAGMDAARAALSVATGSLSRMLATQLPSGPDTVGSAPAPDDRDRDPAG